MKFIRKSTINNFIETAKDFKDSGLDINTYIASIGLAKDYFKKTLSKIETAYGNNLIDEETFNEVINAYRNIDPEYSITRKETSVSKQEVDTDDRAEVSYERDEDGKIQFYVYKIFRRDKPSLCGKFTRNEMNDIYRLYSYYGAAITQREISRQFPELSLVDFKRILRAFNITKASAPFAPHMFEEYSEEQLNTIQQREKENDFLRKLENERIKNTEKLLKKYAQENIELKEQLDNISSFKVNVPEITNKYLLLDNSKDSDKALNLYLADIHLGASMTSGALYQENVNYGFEEAQRRLERVIDNVIGFGDLDTINIVLMGDNIDCPGFFGKTARMDHDIPENMDPREQANKYIELICWFIQSLNYYIKTKDINVYSVPCGNHAGNFEYIANKALLAIINNKYGIKTTLWEQFYGVFECQNNIFIGCHGKDDRYCKRGLPLNLDEKSKILIYEWLEENNINSSKPIHIIKGDLHSNNMNSCRKFTYRNVLSLFGSSDYSAYNFSRNSYGVSYDLIINSNVISGTFENM